MHSEVDRAQRLRCEMARLFGTDYFEERAEGEWTNEFYDWYKPIAQKLYSQNKDRDRADPLYLRGGPTDEYPWGHGIAFPDPPAPLSAKITKLPGGVLPDFIRHVGCVSERVKNKIEEIEPGIHQFFPVDVVLPDGSGVAGRYWRFCNMNLLDTLVLEKSEHMYAKYPNQEKFPNYFRYEHNANGPPVLALSKSVMGDKAVWLDYKLHKDFFSDQFADWLDAKAIGGWEEHKNSFQPVTIIEV